MELPQKLKELTGITDHIKAQEIIVVILTDYQEYIKEHMPEYQYLLTVGSISSYAGYLNGVLIEGSME